jgi:hypothetical protein
MEYTLYSFFGVIYLGLPLVAYDFVCSARATALSMGELARFVVIGCSARALF